LLWGQLWGHARHSARAHHFHNIIDDIDVAAAEVSTIKKFADDTSLRQEINGEEEIKKAPNSIGQPGGMDP